MSCVSTVIIITCRYDKRKIGAINDWMRDNHDKDYPFIEVSKETSAGDKYPQRSLFWGGFNFLNEEEFVSFFKTLKWDGTLLIIGSEESDKGYRIVMADNDDPYPSRIMLEMPTLRHLTCGLPLLTVSEFNKPQGDPKQESDEYFRDLNV